VAGACAVERTTAVELAAPTDDAAGDGSGSGGDASQGASDARADGTSDAPVEAGATGGDAPTEAPTETVSSCTQANAACTVSNNGCNVGGYYLYDNQDNCGADSGNQCGPERAYGCVDGDGSDGTVSFVVTSTQAAGNTTVLSYSAMQENLDGTRTVGSLLTLTSTFAETSPSVGVFEDAYDVWLNAIGPGGKQIMVWVDTHGRTPSGSMVTTTPAIGGRTYDVWMTPDGSYIALVATPTFTSGTVDLFAIFNWVMTEGWLSASDTLWQLEFGVEIASTGSEPATFEFSDFSIEMD
jgi:hypothetical protein